MQWTYKLGHLILGLCFTYSRPQDLYVGVNLLHISLLPELLNRLHAFPLQKKNTFMSSCKYLCLFTCSCIMESVWRKKNPLISPLNQAYTSVTHGCQLTPTTGAPPCVQDVDPCVYGVEISIRDWNARTMVSTQSVPFSIRFQVSFPMQHWWAFACACRCS